MSADPDSGGATLPPDDAFSVLGNETRMEIIQALAEASDPLPFSELRERVGVSDSGQFNYHLNKLTGHFVEDAEDGYSLRREGERVIEAVVSGAVTETPVIEPTQVDWPCSQCGAPTELSYQQEWVALSCTECPGLWGGTVAVDDSAPAEQLEQGYLGGLSLPSAAIQGREVEEVLQTAYAWDFLERMARSHGICPRCAAQIDRWLTVCENHDADDGLCEACGSRNRVRYHTNCPNCHDETEGTAPVGLHGATPTMEFITSHGFNPVTPTENQMEVLTDATDERVIETDPIKVEITYQIDEDVLSLIVDENLNILEETRSNESAEA